MRKPSLTVLACTRPLALSTVMTPSTERSETAPLPPVTRALPCTVFDRDFRLRAFNGGVEIRARQVDRHPAWHRDLVIHKAAGAAAVAGTSRANAERVVHGLCADGFARTVRGLDPDAILIPRADHDFAGLVVQHEARAFGDVNCLLGTRSGLGPTGPCLDGLLRRVVCTVARLRESRRAQCERERGRSSARMWGNLFI